MEAVHSGIVVYGGGFAFVISSSFFFSKTDITTEFLKIQN